MHAIPQPSGWPDLGFGWGHPKSRKFRPVSASWRNAMSVSTGTGLRLTSPSMRHMSAQLVSDLPEERDPILPVLLSLDALRPLPVHDAEDAPTPRGLRDHDVHGIRGRREDRHDLGHVPEGPQHVDRICIPKEYDEEMARSHGQGVLRRERFEVLRVALHPDQARTGGLAEPDPEMDPRYGSDEGLVDVLRRLDEVRLTEDHIQVARVLDSNELRVHRHRRCIRPRELKSCCDSIGVRYVHAQGRQVSVPVRWHGAVEGTLDDPWRGGGTGRARGPRPRGDHDPGAFREREGEGTRDRRVHGGPISFACVPDPPEALLLGRSRRPAVLAGLGGQLDEGVRGRGSSARARDTRPRTGSVIVNRAWSSPS